MADELELESPLSSQPPAVSPYDSLLARNERSAPAVATRLAVERRDADRDLGLLLRLGGEEARRRVARARRRFRSPFLAQHLLEHSRAAMEVSPARARHLADLAYRVVLYPRQRNSFTVELMTTALVYRAQAEALLGDLETAELGFALARRLRSRLPITDFGLRAEMDLFEGLLCRKQRRFHRADRLLLRAWRLFLTQRTVSRAVEALLEFVLSRLLQGDPLGALEGLQRCRRFAGELPARILARCEIARLEALFALERWEALRAALPVALGACRPFPRLHGHACRFAGRLASRRGRTAEAERMLLASWGALRGRGEDFEAARSSLDLAEHYLRRGARGRGQQAAERCLHSLLAGDVPPEARLVIQALRRGDALSVATVAELRGTLDRLRDAPRPAPVPC
ncbi:MAG: hypothetical protein AAF604_10550 [Acidobacteriota bacterium]